MENDLSDRVCLDPFLGARVRTGARPVLQNQDVGRLAEATRYRTAGQRPALQFRTYLKIYLGAAEIGFGIDSSAGRVAGAKKSALVERLICIDRME